MSERKPVFIECLKCGELWKVATIPMEVGAFARALRAHCPNCGTAGKELVMCPTEGPDAVTEPRNGSDPAAA